MNIGKANWKKRLGQALWLLAGIGTIVLLGAAMQKKDRKRCSDIRIEISGAEQHMFIDEQDILRLLRRNGEVTGEPVSALNLRTLETLIEKDPWVKNAEMFFDNNQVLEVRIEERQPVARLFTIGGSSFYVDSGGLRLPLSDKLSARVPVFTGFPSGKLNLSKPDSALLKEVVDLGQYIQTDSFWMAQIAQVDIKPEAGFELVPLVGDHTVILGRATDLDNKFRRLYSFYKQAWVQNGINTYSRLDVQYRNQVVALRRGFVKPVTDSIASTKVLPVLVKPETTTPLNNKTNNHSLSKERSMKQPAVAPKKAKAVMKKQTTKTHTL